MGPFLGDPKKADLLRAYDAPLVSGIHSRSYLAFVAAHIAKSDSAAGKRAALYILYCVEYLLSENPKLGAPGRVPGRVNS